MTTTTNTTVFRGADNQLYDLTVEGTAEVERGPLGRFIDLAEQIKADGLTVPPAIEAALHAEANPTITED